jgi:hypothetical protein
MKISHCNCDLISKFETFTKINVAFSLLGSREEIQVELPNVFNNNTNFC